eukprot:CAMPEP_0115231846 /NCGR_PEP_ID=MMETSP0270-20121206/33451_1 /TAXON_ID=71861 /ORGANISM="Scrippsiella trochoidea, Strain CCMP3099" /LENGTH=42 /DNA_ID= /DNA_START= /DNA_END= /DNA_ORIENTATION=
MGLVKPRANVHKVCGKATAAEDGVEEAYRQVPLISDADKDES